MGHHVAIAFERHPYGLVKKRLMEGAGEDSSDWTFGHLLVFPEKVRLAVGGGGNSSESFQIRVPMDDEHTWHLCYDAFTVPGVELPKQEVIPLYKAPVFNPTGAPAIDYILGQDMVAWYGQGAVVDRSEERLARSDEGVILFRRLLKEQMELVERGEEPTINVFRDPAGPASEYLSTLIHEDPRTSSVRDGRINLSGNHGRYNPHLEEWSRMFEAVGIVVS
jgi:5,5'-dehydrodivanillate O-demethylase